ncbi:hypothetical protein C8F04DRAFT_1403007 [Mycena alexandri]|uniref:Uncharacterized protein n=1 Tax=Mycena alexandri TaxID=1745969 RepID=A0AAD6S5Q2_9AGAR|nr:hypothetical protein C8F04DRAFT_1403007 [Mycena alexandri]
MRSTWSQKCLKGQGKRVIDRADTVDTLIAGTLGAGWTQTSSCRVASSYNALLNPILVLFQHDPHIAHAFLALSLSAYETLLKLQPCWDTLLVRRGSENAKANELRDGLRTLCDVCLHSFPKFLADIKRALLAKAVPGGDTSTGVADWIVSAVMYMDHLPEVHSAASALLLQLGETGTGKRVILEHFVFDVITTAINATCIQVMSYLRHHKVFSSTHDALLDLLSRPAQDAVNGNFCTAKAGYFDVNFSPLLQMLTDEPSNAKGRSSGRLMPPDARPAPHRHWARHRPGVPQRS